MHNLACTIEGRTTSPRIDAFPLLKASDDAWIGAFDGSRRPQLPLKATARPSPHYQHSATVQNNANCPAPVHKRRYAETIVPFSQKQCRQETDL